MAGKREPSKADQALLRALAAAGFPGYSGRTVESWREEGLLVKTEQRPLGRGRGSTSAYPPDAARQAIALASILKRHHSFDKAAALLWLHGYPVNPERVRAALLAGLVFIDEKISQHTTDDPDTTAQAIAEAILSERLRTKEERAWRRNQIREAGGRENLKQTYARLVRMFIGGANLGGFLAAYKTVGQDFRQLLGLEEGEFRAFELHMDGIFSELNAGGGFSRLLREAIIEAPPQGLRGLRNYFREVRTWMASLGVSVSPPAGFYADADEALLHPEADHQELGPASEDVGS